MPGYNYTNPNEQLSEDEREERQHTIVTLERFARIHMPVYRAHGIPIGLAFLAYQLDTLPLFSMAPDDSEDDPEEEGTWQTWKP